VLLVLEDLHWADATTREEAPSLEHTRPEPSPRRIAGDAVPGGEQGGRDDRFL